MPHPNRQCEREKRLTGPRAPIRRFVRLVFGKSRRAGSSWHISGPISGTFFPTDGKFLPWHGNFFPDHSGTIWHQSRGKSTLSARWSHRQL